MSSASGSGARAMPVSFLGAEVLDDDFLDVAVTAVQRFDCQRDSMRSARVSPMPIKIPVVNGTLSMPAASMVASRIAGALSGEPWCGPLRRPSRGDTFSNIMPWRQNLAERGDVGLAHYAGIDVG